MTQAIVGSEVVLKRGVTAIAEVKGVRGPGMSRNTVDVTSFDSDGWREFISTLADGGTVSFTLNFNPSVATHDSLTSDFEDGDLHEYSLTFPDAGTAVLTFDCIVTGFEIAGEMEQAVQANVSMKISGQPVWS